MPKMYSESSHELKGRLAINTYIRRGKGIVTLLSPTNKYHTYSFSRPKNPSTFPPDTLFVYVLVESNQWRYVGMYVNASMRITRSSKYRRDSEVFKGAKYIVKMMHHDFDTPMKLLHEGCCAVCGRKLTNAKSIEIGIGRHCMNKLADVHTY